MNTFRKVTFLRLNFSGEKEGADSSGKSLKYTLISMFSVNMVLKLLVSSSAATMWSLIHVLQVFRYILMINLDMPKLIDILMEYLAVVIGEIDEAEDMIPDWFGKYIVNVTDLGINMTLYERFEEHGKHTFFLIVQAMTPHTLPCCSASR